jgi:hypothetical protein
MHARAPHPPTPPQPPHSAGVELLDPSGTRQVVFPRLLSYVVDLPEQADITGIKGGSTPYPCECCWVHHSDLGLLQTYQHRTEFEQIGFLNNALFDDDFTRLAGLSIHPVPSGVWGFCDGDTPQGSSTYAFGFDSLHVDDLGVFVDIIKSVRPYLQKFLKPRRVNQLIAEFNSRFAQMPRSDDFSLPGPTSKYFPECPMFQGKEHRNAMQVCVACVCGLTKPVGARTRARGTWADAGERGGTTG